MVQEGKIDSEKASEIIEVLQKKEETTVVKSNQYLNKMLKVRIVSQENDNVSINLPIKLVKAVLKAGHSIASSIPDSQKYVKDINIDLIMEAIESELDGQIVDIKSANGDTVAIVIE
ncbi:MAG: hypothetical protein AB2392_16150 [Neobacillus sp.]